MTLLIVVGIMLALMVFPSWRLEMFKPEHSGFKVLVYLAAWKVFDLAFGIPVKGFSTLEEIGIVAMAAAILIPLIMLGEHYSRKWWKVTEK